MAFYNIRRNNDEVQILQKTDFELSESVPKENVTEFHDAFIVSHEDGLSDLYIPEREYRRGTYFLTSKYHWVFSKIDEYCLHQHGDLFAFRCVGEKYWRFLSLENFERGLSDNIVDSMLLDLPTIPYSHRQTVGFKEEFTGKIVEFSPDEYPDENFSAYWLKDKDGMIWGTKFMSVSKPFDYQIRLKTPVTKMEFIRQTHETDEHGKEDGVAEFWKITTSENETAILLFSRSSKKFVIFNPNDFLDDLLD